MTRKNKSGFERNDAKGKPRYDLIPIFMLDRLAALYAKGAEKFGENNWMKACNQEDYDSFEASFCRHSVEFRVDAQNEDHFAALIWNAIGMEHVKNQLK